MPPDDGWRPQVYYSVSNETFFSSLSSDPEEPLAIVKRSSGNPAAAAVLDRAYAGLLEAIGPILEASGVSPEELAAPDQLMAGVWRRPSDDHPFGQGFTAPTKASDGIMPGVLSASLEAPAPRNHSSSSSSWCSHCPAIGGTAAAESLVDLL